MTQSDALFNGGHETASDRCQKSNSSYLFVDMFRGFEGQASQACQDLCSYLYSAANRSNVISLVISDESWSTAFRR